MTLIINVVMFHELFVSSVSLGKVALGNCNLQQCALGMVVERVVQFARCAREQRI